MARFGGAVKLTGESEYKAALKQITQNLREVSSEMKVVSSSYDKNDKSTEALAAQSDVLNRKLDEQKNKLSVLQNQYSAMNPKYQESTQKHQQLIAKYDDEKAKLTQIGQTLGTTSKEYEDQKKVVDGLEQEVKQSTKAQEANEKSMSQMRVQMNNAQSDINKTTRELDDLGKEATDTGKAIEKSSDGFTVFKGIVADLGARVIQTAVEGLKKLGAAAVNVGKQAVDAYGEYEQLVGGVDTLFKNASKEVQKYAANAFKTAGMSANEYMSTVTSFSASLIQSLGGDTAKAAKVADMAITDMSDNANKMGTSMEMIQNAYQGFAKQNYTMLDNLKLGYGGTKTEMERLLKDAQKLTGIKYDINNLNDVYEAIHAIQSELGITGTTAKEASSTIEGSAASMKSAWGNLLAGLADDNADLGDLSKKLVQSLATYVKNVAPRIAQVLKTIVTAAKEVLPEVMRELEPIIDEVFPGLTDGIKTAAKFAKDLCVVLGSMAVAFGVMKAAAAVSSIITAFSGMSAAITAASGAMGVLNAVMAANPIGAVVVAVGLLTAAGVGLVNMFKEANENTSENAKLSAELAEKQQELAEKIEQTRQAREQSIKEATAEAGAAEFLYKRLEELNSVENKSADQKEEMKRLVAELNELVPDLALAYDDEADKLNKSTEAIRDNIQASKELALAKAYQDQLAEIAKEIAEAETNAAEATEEHKKQVEKFNEAYDALAEFEKNNGKDRTKYNSIQLKQWGELYDAVNDEREVMESLDKTVGLYKDQIKQLGDEYDTATNKASDYMKAADITKALSNLTEQAKSAGVSIPKALADGMRNGELAIPSTLDGLQKLINFDSAVNNAGLAGQKIPKSISEGVVNGKLSITDAINQIKGVIDVSDKAQKAYDDGANIPSNLAQGVRDGTYTVAEANQILNDAMKFDAKVEEAKGKGFEIDSSLAEGIRSNELSPSEAMNRVQALINYQASLDNANLSGVGIPENLKNGILSGEISVAEANDAMNRWIDLNKALDHTGYTGDEIPASLAEKILNGETSVKDANNQMNNWIKFQAALKASAAAGDDIPEEIESGILSGKLKPADAIQKLNDAAGRKADELTGDLSASGKNAGEAYVDGTKSGTDNNSKQRSLWSSISGLGSSMLSTLMTALNAHSPSRETAKIGGYFLDGINNGVSNRNKRNTIFSSIFGFGLGLLDNLRTSLDEHSPSKATEEMGLNLLAGLGIGLDKEKDSVLKDVKGIGEEITSTLQDQLAQEIKMADIQAGTPQYAGDMASLNNQDAMVSAFKTALSQMKVELDGEVAGEFIDKTVSRLVYA